MHLVELLNRSKFNVLDDGINKKLKVPDSGSPTIDKVGGSDGKEVCNPWADFLQQIFSLSQSQHGNLFTCLTDLHNMAMVFLKPFKCCISGRWFCFQLSNAMVKAIGDAVLTVGSVTNLK